MKFYSFPTYFLIIIIKLSNAELINNGKVKIVNTLGRGYSLTKKVKFNSSPTTFTAKNGNICGNFVTRKASKPACLKIDGQDVNFSVDSRNNYNDLKLSIDLDSGFFKIESNKICDKYTGNCEDDTLNVGKCLFGTKSKLKLIDCATLKSSFESNICTSSSSGSGSIIKKPSKAKKCPAFVKLEYTEELANWCTCEYGVPAIDCSENGDMKCQSCFNSYKLVENNCIFDNSNSEGWIKLSNGNVWKETTLLNEFTLQFTLRIHKLELGSRNILRIHRGDDDRYSSYPYLGTSYSEYASTSGISRSLHFYVVGSTCDNKDNNKYADGGRGESTKFSLLERLSADDLDDDVTIKFDVYLDKKYDDSIVHFYRLTLIKKSGESKELANQYFHTCGSGNGKIYFGNGMFGGAVADGLVKDISYKAYEH